MKRAKIVRHTRRERAAKEIVRCDIDDDVIELRALDRLEDAALLAHVDSCSSCRSRVNEYRAVIASLRQALEDLERRKKETKTKRDKGDLDKHSRVH
jgi:hypothetical protein